VTFIAFVKNLLDNKGMSPSPSPTLMVVMAMVLWLL